MSAEFHHGEPVMIDYTPGSAVSAGDIVAIGDKNCVAHRDIAANELGALSYPGGQSVYKVDLLTANAYALGDPVTVTLATGLTEGAAGDPFGVCVQAADEAAGDTYVLAMLDN